MNNPASNKRTQARREPVQRKAHAPKRAQGCQNHRVHSSQVHASKTPSSRCVRGSKSAAASFPAGQFCPVAEQCGACTFLQVPYERQLEAKQAFLVDLFADVMEDQKARHDNIVDTSDNAGDTKDTDDAASVAVTSSSVLLPLCGMDDPRAYRNKIISPFVAKKRQVKSKSDIACGMYARGTHHIIECDMCLVEHPVGRKIIRAVRDTMVRYGVAPYNEDTGAGLMRHVVVRVGHKSGEVLVTLVTNGVDFPGAKQFARALVHRIPAITSVVQNINTRMTNAILGSEERVLYGPGFILDTLCGLSFKISSTSFYQVNTVQTEVLYTRALDAAFGVMLSSDATGTREENVERTRSLRILDAYCGTGTIGLSAVALAQAEGISVELVGVDAVSSAIKDARENARHNHITDAQFFAQDATAFMRTYEGKAFDIAFLDPPRAGSTPEFLDALIRLEPARIVYISCNPKTQRRDLGPLISAGYRLESIQGVDMFPHSDHIECICSLSYREQVR